MGVALSGRSLVHSWENGNVYSLVCWSIENDYTRDSAIANPTEWVAKKQPFASQYHFNSQKNE
jgi:hypothetical protein